MKKQTKTEKFCHSILGLKVGKSKALVNLVMGLASQQGAKSVVEVSEGACYHYQHSSISQVLSALIINGQEEEQEEASEASPSLTEELLSLKAPHFAKPFADFWLLNTDISSVFRPYSRTLPDRGYVHKPNNQVKGNKPVGVGYEFSTIGLSARLPRYGLSEAPWNLPLSMELIPFEANRNTFTAQQVNDLLNSEAVPFDQELVVNALDSNYSSPEYIADTHDQPHLVNIIRLASNRNVWKKLTPEQINERQQTKADNRGAPPIYGAKYPLSQLAKGELPPDEEQVFSIKLANGRQVEVRASRWVEMMIRSKRGKSMKDKPFDLVRIYLIDPQNGSPIFTNPMWLGVWGNRRGELSQEQIYWAYRNRFDIEHFLRFGKQRLLLDQSQTPDRDRLQSWLEVVGLAYWLLWVASEEASHQTKKWRQYDPVFKRRKQEQLRVSPSNVQNQLGTIILGFDQEPFIPKVKIKGKGRIPGTTFHKRTHHPVRKKAPKQKKTVP